LDRLARNFFAPFWHVKKGRGKWRDTWSRKNVAELSRLSTNPLRQHHYRLLYGRGSEFTHSAPVAVFGTMHLKNEPEELANWIVDVDAQEERELREISATATVFLFEIAVLIGRRLPEFDVRWCADPGMLMIGRMLGVAGPIGASMRESFIEWLEKQGASRPEAFNKRDDAQ
jgi:hypothetical protein